MPLQVFSNASTIPQIKVTPLGAGQDVGRSCLLVEIGGKNIMLDCGMHMGYNDERRFPDFSFIDSDAVPINLSSKGKDGSAPTSTNRNILTDHIDCVIISHFHLDHCGALPYMTEMIGYNGPIYMTYPTKAITPLLLEDMRRVAVERNGETNFFTSQMIKDCMKKVIPVNLHQVVKVDDDLEIKAYYAGHVLGAALFHVSVAQSASMSGGDPTSNSGNFAQSSRLSLVYTGDYNMTPDRHLGAASIDRCEPDLLITESTYATTIRDSKRCREGDFLKKVHDCVDRGGKVLIPVFALGRAQELCILLETYWQRMNLTHIPIYFSAGMTERANHYYKLFTTWTNENIKETFVDHNLFDFKHIKPLDKSYISNPGAMVVFATPGMLHGGLSLAIFEEWCGAEANMIVMPGYCVAGTVGNKILNGQRRIELSGSGKGKPNRVLDVKMSVQYMSFSAHADAKGILQLINQCRPLNVMMVHGESAKMEFLKTKIEEEFNGLPDPCSKKSNRHKVENVFMPANGETAIIPCAPIKIQALISNQLLNELNAKSHQMRQNLVINSTNSNNASHSHVDMNNRDKHIRPVEGMVIVSATKREKKKKSFDQQSASNESLSLTSPIRVLSLSEGCEYLQKEERLNIKPFAIRFTYNLNLNMGKVHSWYQTRNIPQSEDVIAMKNDDSFTLETIASSIVEANFHVTWSHITISNSHGVRLDRLLNCSENEESMSGVVKFGQGGGEVSVMTPSESVLIRLNGNMETENEENESNISNNGNIVVVEDGEIDDADDAMNGKTTTDNGSIPFDKFRNLVLSWTHIDDTLASAILDFIQINFC